MMKRGVGSNFPGQGIRFFDKASNVVLSVSNDPLLNLKGELDPWKRCYSAQMCWDKLAGPVTRVPASHIGFDNLRQIAKRGVCTAIPYYPPAGPSDKVRDLKAAHRLLFAGNVAYGPADSAHKSFKGLMFHPGNSTLTAHVRGEANPHLGFGRQHGRNKLWEARLVAKIDPTAMAETIAIDELPNWNAPEVIKLRKQILARIKHSNKMSRLEAFANVNKITEEVTLYIDYIFAGLRAKFIDGAFIKPVESSCSGDNDSLITTMGAESHDLARRFVQYLIKNFTLVLSSPDISREKLLAHPDAAVLVVHDLLYRPREVIGQAALKLAKTNNGEKFEVRVDFLHGYAVQSWMRYSALEYYPKEEKEARDFVNQFFSKVRYPNNTLCGGADIALGLDGKWRFIEFNLGSESFSLTWGTSWNLYVSKILGRNTDLISTFENVYASPLAVQINFLCQLEKTVLNHPDVDDLILVYKWFRDRCCQDFALNPTNSHKNAALVYLTKLFTGVPNITCLPYKEPLIDGARFYMSHELVSRSETRRFLEPEMDLSEKKQSTRFKVL